MKKTLSLVAATAAITLLLAGCNLGGTSDTGTTGTTAPTAAPEAAPAPTAAPTPAPTPAADTGTTK